jgi:hypothetical protein
MASFYSPLFGPTYSTIVSKNPMERAARRLFRRLPKTQELMLTLNGAAAGSSASVTRKRVQHDRDELGGARVVETRTILSRNTTSADKTAIDKMISEDSRIDTPADGAGDNWDA